VEFEWDEDKRLANIEKHQIDFDDLDQLFDGRPLYEFDTGRFGEARTSSTGEYDGRLVTAIWTWRGPKRRLISVRRARDAEERAHRQLYGGGAS